MVHILKRILHTFMVAILLMGLFPIATKAETDPYIPKNKVVVFVYDDSGSMFAQLDQNGQEYPIDNWKYGNYALQSFVAMMDTNDKLDVVYMSYPYEAESIQLSKNVRQLGIDRVREWLGQSGTPLNSVFTAMDKLDAYVEENSHSDFWFVLLTDGVFNELNYLDARNSERQIKKDKEEVFDRLKSLKKKMDEKGASFQTALIPIETYLIPDEQLMMAEFKQLWADSSDGYILESDGQLDIIHRINEVAALMTNRDPNEEDSFQLNPVFEGEKLILQSPFPLRRISIIEQSTDANAAFSMKEFHINGQKVKDGIEGPYIISTPDDSYQLNPPIKGSLTHFKNVDGDQIIEKGTYTIVFEDPLTDEQKKNIQILAEPAIDFTIGFQKINEDGTLTDDPSTFFVDSQMQMETTLIKSESENEAIDLTDVAVNELFEVTAEIEGDNIPLIFDSESQKFIGHFTLIEKENIPVSVTVKIKGFYQKEKETVLHGYPIRVLELVPESSSWSAPLDKLSTAAPFVLTPYIDGEPISEEELTEVFKNLTIDTGDSRLNIETKQDGNQILLYPQEKWPLFLTSVGDISVKLTLDGKYPKEQAETTIQLHIGDISWFKKYGPLLMTILVSFLVIAYIIGIIVKPRFDYHRISIEYKRSRRRERMRDKRGSTEGFKGSWFNRWFIPYIPEKKTINDLTFKAHGKKDRVLLVKECQEENMIVRHEKLLERSNKEDILIFNNDEIQLERGKYTSVYIFRTNS